MQKEQAPLKIGLLHYSCPPVVGGVEEVLRQHARLLHRAGHRVQVLVGMGEPYTTEFEVRFIPLLGSQNQRVKQANTRSARGDHRLTNELSEEIEKLLLPWSREQDVIVAHNVLHMPFNLALTLALNRLAARPDTPPLVSWAHDSPYFRDSCPHYLASPPWDALGRPQPGVHYVTISHSRRRLFEEHLGDFPWRVIKNGVDQVEFFNLDPRSARLMEELELLSRDLVLVMPARITPRKNLELAIHVVHAIKKQGHNVLFLLTGAYDPHEPHVPTYYRRLKYWIDELELNPNIAILAEYTFADGTRLVPDMVLIRDLYLVADMLLMTSRDEGFCLPILEAGLVKLPIACPGIPPFTELGRGLCFFDLDDPPPLTAKRILDYLEQTSTHRMFREVMRNYSWEVICRREIEPFLQELARDSAACPDRALDPATAGQGLG